MHPRNIYGKERADFAKLGENYEEFRQHLIPTKCGGYTINFKDPRALRELTVCLLDNDFGLKVELPLDRLIPTIPQRLNYIHWIEDLLVMIPKKVEDVKTKGIDIGTGASCVYPLLGAKINNWIFFASEVDEMSFRYACENVKRNNLEGNINVELVNSDTILKSLLKNNEQCEFCMCNPPFFSEESEATGNRSRTGTRPQPSSVCTGTVTETVTTGGEVEFVGKIIEDSLELKTRIKWYTTMLGKKSSVATIVSKLKENNICNIVTTEFCQGRTMRWGVAWTFLSNVTMEDPPHKKRKSKPLEFTFSPKTFHEDEILRKYVEQDELVSRISVHIRKMLLELQIIILSEFEQNTTQTTTTRLHCRATTNTWGNQRRKRRQAERKLGTNHANEADINVTKDDANQCCNSPMENFKNELVNDNLGQKKVNLRKSTTTLVADCFGTTSNVTCYVTSVGNSSICETMCSKEDRKRAHDSIKLPSEGYFLEFIVEVGVKLSEVIPGVLPNMFLRMNWKDGQQRNSFYQLFQYFQNRAIR